jgi:methionyl aminopeptidase
MTFNMIAILSVKEIERMRIAGAAAAALLDFLESLIKPGITTQQLDDAAAIWAAERGYKHAPLNYHGFPKHICTSINEVVCHGIPSQQVLVSGDIINVDVTLNVNGWHGDTSRTFIVGSITTELTNLVNVTRECLMKGIEIVRPGLNISEIGRVIEQHAILKKLYVIKEFCGHGIGRAMHMMPIIHHVYVPSHINLQAGMCFTIEPILSMEPSDIEVLTDNWTVVTKNKSYSAQFEHTILVTESGYEILTLSN